MSTSARPGFVEQQYRFTAHIRDPGNNPPPDDVEDRRMAVYRELFYNNVEGFLSNSFPVLRELMDDESWHALARDFFAIHRCRSPLFLEIAREFLDYLEQERGERPGDLPFLQELAHYEWVELAISVAETEATGAVSGKPDPVSTDTVPVLSPLAWPLAYRYPVHRIGPDFVPEAPGEQPTWLLVFRNMEDEIRFLELNAVSARLFALLQENRGASAGTVLEQIASELDHPQPQVVVEGGLEILREWSRRGIVTGTTTGRSTDEQG